MTAVKSYEADRYVAAPPRDVLVFLVFGSDAGLISERSHRLVRQAVDDPKDPFQLVRLDGEVLAQDPARLIDEVRQVPLFGGRRAVLVETGQKNIAPAVEPVLALGQAGCAVIIEAGALKRDAPLRKLVERSRLAAAIECFPDDARDLGRLIEQEAAAANLTVEPAAREALLHLLGADRLSSRSELAKLAFYAHGKGGIFLEDVEAVVADASATVLDAAIDGAFLGDVAAVESTLGRVFAEGGEAGMLLGAALRHAVLLHRARADVEAHRSLAEAIQAATPFGFHFRRKQAFEQQVRKWTSARLTRSVDLLADAVAKCRREPRLAEAIAARALWSVAFGAAGQTKDPGRR